MISFNLNGLPEALSPNTVTWVVRALADTVPDLQWFRFRFFDSTVVNVSDMHSVTPALQILNFDLFPGLVACGTILSRDALRGR